MVITKVIKIGLLLHMSHVAWSVRLCAGHTGEIQKHLNQSRCRVWDWRGFKEPCIRWNQDRTNLFAATRGDKTAMRSL